MQCFQCSSIQKPCKILLCTIFFSFLAVFPLPESYQNDPKFHFNTLLRSDTQKSSKNVENTTVFWSRCETVFATPPAKADIATAILTNVIEHLVLLLPPNKHAFTAKAVWADFRVEVSRGGLCIWSLWSCFQHQKAWTSPLRVLFVHLYMYWMYAWFLFWPDQFC